MKKALTVLFIALLALLMGQFQFGASQAQDSFDRHAMLQSLVDNVILPGYQAFVDASAELETSLATLNENPSLENLEAAQTAWRNTSNAWEEISFMGINIELMALHNQVDKRPINEVLMLRRIEAAETIDVELANSLGSTQKGLPAIEYFLFDAGLSNEEILQNLQSNEDFLSFVAALGQSLHLTAQDLYNFWSPDAGNFAESFVAADQVGGDAQASINILVNEIFSTFSGIVDMGLGRPAGLVNESEPRPDLDLAARSGQTLSQLEHRLIGVQRLFNGSEAIGVDDYLNFLGADYEGHPLSDEINARFELALEALRAIEMPLYQAVIENPEAVLNAYNAIQDLYIPIRVDMSSQLGILVTFSDTDGDS
jgi:predicted lipoprotein